MYIIFLTDTPSTNSAEIRLYRVYARDETVLSPRFIVTHWLRCRDRHSPI